MSEIKELKLYSNSKVEETLINSNDKYIVPLYQRAYSWKDKEIEQLLDDIYDFEETKYYLGSLIVHRRNDGKYEVIDGQQRLTTLFLLFKCLGLEVSETFLTFDCREKSNETLKHLGKDSLEEKQIEPNIKAAYDIIRQGINGKEDEIKERISRIILYRIEVPKHTDLNRYFEIMNTRGEQLEQHDILKAKLMSFIEESNKSKNINEELKKFAMIWDACSDMTGYVQMHYKREVRDSLFGSHWDVIYDNSLNRIPNEGQKTKNAKSEYKVKEILNKEDFAFLDSNYVSSINGETEERVRFESIIDFTHFLLHVLKTFVNVYKITSKDDNQIVPDLLDDKKLVENFENVVNNGVIEGKEINKYEFAIDFINCLNKCRFLFDKFFIKREYPLDDKEGRWSIKSIYTSGQQSQKKAYFYNTKFNRKKEQDKKEKFRKRNSENIMIQSCLRVSYTSPKIMHWITILLIYAYTQFSNESNIADLSFEAERIAKEEVKEKFLIPNNYKKGVDTPHIVLNYLDFLLWKKDKEKYENFVFEFRNSVEHWYPQHPSDNMFSKWEDGVDSFGNLCIIQRNINSKFSNMAPLAKKSSFDTLIKKGSLKLRIMAEITPQNNEEWKDKTCFEHEKEMIKILKENVGYIDNEQTTY